MSIIIKLLEKKNKDSDLDDIKLLNFRSYNFSCSPIKSKEKRYNYRVQQHYFCYLQQQK